MATGEATRRPAASSPAKGGPTTGGPATGNAVTWSPGRRRLVSVLVLLHCLAIFSSPMAGPPPASDLSRWIEGWFDPYLRAGFLNHGYRFFAPNPGPSHLVRYEVTHADGRVESHRFPSTDEQWPRLYYHRHFMVAERVNQLVSLPAAEEWAVELRDRRALVDELMRAGHGELAKEAEQQIEASRAGYEEQLMLRDELLHGIAEYFLRYHDAQSIKVYSVRHPLPSPLDVRAGAKLDDPASYLERLVYQLPEVQELPLESLEEITP